jgi:hypothetical protein
MFDNILLLFNPITKPEETHVHAFGPFFIDSVISQSDSDYIVDGWVTLSVVEDSLVHQRIP